VFLFDVDNTLLVVLLTDGDVVFQPHKVDRSGLYRAVHGNALIYIHKERELADVETRYPADHYVLVDDKLAILTAIKKIWKTRVTTVFVRQGHYALDAGILARNPNADISIAMVLATCCAASLELSSPRLEDVPTALSENSTTNPNSKLTAFGAPGIGRTKTTENTVECRTAQPVDFADLPPIEMHRGL
jgi:hypothetical protein